MTQQQHHEDLSKYMALHHRFSNLTNLEINMDYVSKDEITQSYVTLDLVCESIGISSQSEFTTIVNQKYEGISRLIADTFRTYANLNEVVNSGHFGGFIPNLYPAIAKKVILVEKIKNIIRICKEKHENEDEIWGQMSEEHNEIQSTIKDYIIIALIKSEVYFKFRSWLLRKHNRIYKQKIE